MFQPFSPSLSTPAHTHTKARHISTSMILSIFLTLHDRTHTYCTSTALSPSPFFSRQHNTHSTFIPYLLQFKLMEFYVYPSIEYYPLSSPHILARSTSTHKCIHTRTHTHTYDVITQSHFLLSSTCTLQHNTHISACYHHPHNIRLSLLASLTFSYVGDEALVA